MYNISVVIPTYNRPRLLNRAIRSVFRQKSPQLTIEVVVIDDCSLEKVDLSEFKWDNVVYKRLVRNIGPQEARNEGIALASGDWILMLDDDDEFLDGSVLQALEKATNIPDKERYPVFFFATSNGHVPSDFQMISAREIMDETLHGDFTPVIQRKLFTQQLLRYLDYPEIVGVGCEHLTWLYISSRFQIPAFDFHLVKVNADAPFRLTSYKNFIKNSLKFALQQDITIDFVKQHNLDYIYPDYLNKKYLGSAIYYLVSGKRVLCRERLSVVRGYKRLATFVVGTLSHMPIPLSKFFFRMHKMRISK
ncbi:glycosyltransferase family 2 protein [Rurimicrobium arvi]|uniref:Glycosyltransferase 2-like domain-containing protein n=1 Tax=Rurimicrobium arvi TaxID=2049916 RepID=A0ABP8MPT3_9BACT